MKASRTFKVVVVGCGSMSHTWLESDATKNHAECVGFVDINIEAAQKRADEFGAKGAIVGTDLKSVLEQTKAEVLYDVSIPEAHYENTLLALSMGVHVMGEKPMADTFERGKAMVEAAKKHNRIYTVIQNRRFMKGIQIIKNAIDSGCIGPLQFLQSDFYNGAHFGGFRDEMDHPLILDMAVHTFDAARFLSGANAKNVFCRAYNPKGSWYRHGANANAIFEMSDDITYVYNGSWCAHGNSTSWECQWRFQGPLGSITWDGNDDIRCEVVEKEEGFAWPIKSLDIPNVSEEHLCHGHHSNIQSIFDAICTGQPAMTDCTDNIHSLSMVHSAIQSSEEKTYIPVLA